MRSAITNPHYRVAAHIAGGMTKKMLHWLLSMYII
jgi:hypothetical protein